MHQGSDPHATPLWESILDHDAPIRADGAAYRSLFLYSARLVERVPFWKPIDTPLAECATPRAFILPPDPAMPAGVARSGFSRSSMKAALR